MLCADIASNYYYMINFNQSIWFDSLLFKICLSQGLGWSAWFSIGQGVAQLAYRSLAYIVSSDIVRREKKKNMWLLLPTQTETSDIC